MPARTKLLSALIVAMLFGLLPTSVRADDSLDRVRKAGVINVGTEAAYAPFEFIKDGKIVGYDKDILDYVMSGLKLTLNQVDTPFDGLFPALLAGKFDVIVTATSMYPDTVTKFAYTMPVAENTQMIVSRKGDSRFKAANDLSGRTVGVQLATGSEKSIRALDANLTADGKPGIDVKAFRSSPEAYLALSNGLVDAIVAQSTQLHTVMAAQPNVYQADAPLTGVRLYVGWVFRPDEKTLRDFFNSKIKELIDSGKIYQLQEKWFGFRTDLPEKGYLPPGAQ